MAASLAVFGGAQDFPVLKGGADRTGKTTNPALYGPGIANLGWWRPNALDPTAQAVVVDNNSPDAANLGLWASVTQIGEWAESPYVPDDNQNPALFPAYRYGFGTAAQSVANPHIPANAAQHSTFTWTFRPAALGGIARNYALYVWLPIGPTYPGLGAARYPCRYFVYEIRYGTNRTEIQVVDTYNAGFGWVRLGHGGGVTNRLYDFDGVNPIRIILHNTVPLDSFGNPLESLDPVNVTNNPLVYADAVLAVPEKGNYKASPVVSAVDSGLPLDIRTVAAFNELSVAIRNGEAETVEKGVVTSYNFDGAPGIDAPNNTRWRFSPLEEDSQLTVYQDDVSGSGYAAGPAWVPYNAPPVFRGTGYHAANSTDQPLLESLATYTPTLADGSYEIWVWIPGSVSGLTLSRDVTYEIREPGGGITTVNVNQDVIRGWFRLGTRRFSHDDADPLEVRVSNLGPASELGRLVYSDQIRFLGATNTNILSTPLQVMARVNVPSLGGLAERPVVIVAAENGKLYCLDAVGNADGTTNIYWTYPSTPDPDNSSWTDPNHVGGEDGPNGIAQMPTGFNLSSGLVARVGGEDYLYIAANNGRVYCIEMAGRGDMDLTTKKPGTTRRRWSFPNDYPAITQPGSLGPSYGSVAFSDQGGQPTLYVPTYQGRLYALDADGNPGNKTTNIRWAYPPVSQPTLGPCEMTPSVEFGKVYVGFRAASGDSGGRFFALDKDTGNVQWEFNGTTAWSSTATFTNADDFVSGPVTIPSTEMSGMPDTVVVANDNRWITALNADTGALIWTTDELGSPVLGNLSYTLLTAYNTAGVLVPSPMVIVPTVDGRFAGLFAEASQGTVYGGNTRLAWGWNSGSNDMETSVAVGRNWMYGADNGGMLYAWHDGGSVIGGAGSTPGFQVVVPNSPLSIPFRSAKVKFITKAAYERLRLPEGDTNNLDYSQATDPANAINRNAFEWGETIYALVYDFPADVDSNPDPNERTQVEFRFSAEGVAVRNLTVRAKRFPDNGANNPPTDPQGSGERLDGYGVLSYTLQGSGSNALPPGNGQVSFGINAQFNQGGPYQSVAINPNPGFGRRDFSIANPIGIAVNFNNGIPLANYALGYTADPSDPEAKVNGSPDLPATAKLENRILSHVGAVQHGQGKSAVWALYDRSLMTLLRGPGRGLDLVRVSRADLEWQGGANAIYKPIDPLAYPGFEDLPNQYPNLSLDYPNLRREDYNIIKDRFGQTENPVTRSIFLAPPTNVDPNDPLTRTLVATPMDFELNVPRFQPPNGVQRPDAVRPPAVPDSAGSQIPTGYYGQLTIYVDGSGNSAFERRGRREAFRTMWLGGSVAIDESMTFVKTELDLGSLAQGAGFSPIAPWIGATTFTPWATPYDVMFQTYQVLNTGNVNLLRMRVAKAYDTGGPLTSWGLYAPANNDASWIDTQYNMWSDIDARFALTPNVLLQKARVGDRSSTELLTNPIRRDNFNLGVTQSWLLPTPEPAAPRLAVTVPIGTPVGTYLTDIYVIEDTDQNESLEYFNDGTGRPREIASTQALRLRFNVRETRITNGHTRNTAPMVHGQVTGNEPFLHHNLQPTAMRNLDGQLVVAYSSNALAFNAPFPTDASLNDAWRIYITTLDGISQTGGGVVGSNPLRDLNSWTPQGGRWFRQEVGPFPLQAPNDPLLFGPTVITETAKFGAPAFAGLGGLNPFNTAQNTNPYLTYLGEGQVTNAAGNRETVYKIFLNRLSIDASGAVSVIGGPWSTNDLLAVSKTKPSILQAGDDATVYFTTTGAGQSAIYFTHFNNGFGPSTKLVIGDGFESVGSVSVAGRTYEGVNRPSEGLSAGNPITEMLFTAKLRGRANREVFWARLRTNASGRPVNTPGTRSPLITWGERYENIASDGDPLSYRVNGAYWLTSATIDLLRTDPNTQLDQSLIKPNTRNLDPETGILTADLYSGGQVYIDTLQGTIRFTGSRPNLRQNIRVRYTPRFLRISTVTTSNYAGPSIMFDNRLVSEYDYWAHPNGTNPSGQQIASDRFTMLFGRTAVGAGQTSRPYMTSVRFGIQLAVNGRPVAIHTNSGGVVTNLQFSAQPTGWYQVDPASGRIYFGAGDEGRQVTISQFTYIDEATGAPVLFNAPITLTVTPIIERSELPVPIENAINESQIYGFIDPFDNLSPANRRPGLIWMIWTSTRSGSPDVYMQTIAPKYTPRPVGAGGP